MKYIYGPLKSRRLGLSLGITLTPYKTCSFNCVYCQLGETTVLTAERREYIPVNKIINELKAWLQDNSLEADALDYITLSGSGEPALNIKIDQLIAEIKKITPAPLAIITNASLLNQVSARKALLGADLIIPSLDAVSPEVFEKINRPQDALKIEDIIDGLIELRKEFAGKIWLEVMVVKGVNDDLAHIRRLKDIIDRINPDKVQINSPVRSTAKEEIFGAEKRKLNKIKEILGDKCETI